MPLTGISVNRLEDSEQYKNAFEISGPLIEKRIAVCQSKEEANHWVELLRKHMPYQSNSNNINQKVSPSQAEIVPQPPPHVSHFRDKFYLLGVAICVQFSFTILQ